MKKKSCAKAVSDFLKNLDQVSNFIEATQSLSDEHVSWAHSYALIKIYKDFENLMLHCLVAAINNDNAHLCTDTGIKFPKHLNKDVCEYLVIGKGYFDFRGRDGLIKKLKEYLSEQHYLITIIKKDKYKTHLEQLVTLRNYAAHESSSAKARCLTAIRQERVGTSGAWIKKRNRLGKLIDALKALALEIKNDSPY